jgi:hypothetical protein
MEKWTIDGYRKPQLIADEVLFDELAKQPVLKARGEYFDVGGINQTEARELTAWLDGLRTPGGREWTEWATDPARREQLGPVLERLDELALIRDSAPITEDTELSTLLDRAAAALEAGLVGTTRDVSPALRQLNWLVYDLCCDNSLPTAELFSEAPARPADPFECRDFWLLTLMLQAQYFRRSSPVALLAAWELVRRAAARSGSAPAEADVTRWRTLLPELVPSLWSTRDLATSISCAVKLLVKCGRPGAERLLELERRPEHPVSGLNFLIEAEAHASDALAKLGQSDFIAALLEAEPELRRRLAMGCYMEEFHITCRFVEMITPMLAKRLNSSLRERMFRYYSEEVGHEAFELATCRGLGIDEAALRAALPLPLRVAFVDTFTAIAERDPIGYLISIFVTEGMLGEKSPLNELLGQAEAPQEEFKDVAARHETLNINLNHSSLSRHMMKEVKTLSVAQQTRALGSLLYLLELNHRGWDEVFEYYAPRAAPAYHGS